MLIAPLFFFPIRVFLFIRSFLLHKKLQIGLFICWMILLVDLEEWLHYIEVLKWSTYLSFLSFQIECLPMNLIFCLFYQFFSKHLILSRPIYSPNVLTVCLLLLYFLCFRINFLEDLEVCIKIYRYEVLDRLIQKIIYKFNFIFHRFKS